MHRPSWILKASVGLLFAAALAACSLSQHIARGTVTHNQTLSHARNQLILLNIARASRKHPLFFTDVTEMTQVVSAESGVSVGVPFGRGTSDAFTAGGTAGVSGGPSATVAVLGSQEFQKGIMTPLKLDILDYYWKQGWPREVLLHLCVRKVRLQKGDKCESYTNSPYSSSFDEFQAFVRDLVDRDVRFRQVPPERPTYIGEIISTAEAAKLENLVDLPGKSLQLDPVKDAATGQVTGYRLRKAGMAWTYDTIAEDALQAYMRSYAEATRGGKAPAAWNEFRASAERDAPITLGAIEPSDENQAGCKDRLEVHMRSPEAVLYYLGEIVRTKREKGKGVWIRTYRGRDARTGAPLYKQRPLFSAEGTCRTDGCPVVQVVYCESCYAIPPSHEESHSMHVLSFVTQLLGLHKSAQELPRGGVVRLVR